MGGDTAIVMCHIDSRTIMESGDCAGKTRMIPAGKMQKLFSDFKQTVSTLYKIHTINVNVLTTYAHPCTYSGLNLSKISEKWEENGPNVNLDQEWPKTASIEIKMTSSY